MGALRDRLHWDDAGTLHDGPRRYLLMRPDVLMGATAALDGPVRAAFLAALAEAARRHGGDSLRAYAASCQGDTAALMRATVSAAADLGWGRWVLEAAPRRLSLCVHDSPFAAGWREAGGSIAGPVCAPVEGMLQALAGQLLGAGARAREVDCGATRGGPCRFEAIVPAGEVSNGG